MKDYDNRDNVTFYFIILRDENDNRQIHAWTDNKDLAKVYMEFHSCKNMSLKAVTNRYDRIVEVINENSQDEIGIYNITVRDPEKKKKHQKNTKIVTIPATSSEMMVIRDEGANFMYTRINYSYLNSAIPYLKNKYQRALQQLFLQNIIMKVTHNRTDPIIEEMEVDQLIVYLRTFPEQFG
ncbi:MAG: hypothetical protein NC489_24350 [Ruminococcus flavefaciens]|nr:hypothetical protein [Ruminococcus flavefaciens]